MFLKKEIKFLAINPEVKNLITPPQRASKYLPNWLKEIEPTRMSIEGATIVTAKKCLPVVEACKEGYVFTSPIDIYFNVFKEDGNYHLYVQCQHNEFCGMPFVDVHSDAQIYTDGNRDFNSIDFRSVYKLINFFIIQTPKGYACRFKSLTNHFNLPISFFEGVVETDIHYQTINFPFLYTGKLKEGTCVIKKGHPLVQIIPYKKEKWKSSAGLADKLKLEKEIHRFNTEMMDTYRNMVRDKNGNTN